MHSSKVPMGPPVALAITCLAGLLAAPLAAQEKPANAPAMVTALPPIARLTLDEIKQRVLSNNKLLTLAALNVQSKDYAALRCSPTTSPRSSDSRSTFASTTTSARC